MNEQQLVFVNSIHRLFTAPRGEHDTAILLLLEAYETDELKTMRKHSDRVQAKADKMYVTLCKSQQEMDKLTGRKRI